MKIIILLGICLIFLSSCNDTAHQPVSMELAITLDDLPLESSTLNTTPVAVSQKILTAFDRHQVPEVYGFVNGSRMVSDAQKRILINWVAAGHALGNHTYSHYAPMEVAIEDYLKDVEKNAAILKFISDNVREMDYHIFRYSYLIEGYETEAGQQARQYLLDKHYKIARVSVNVYDWVWAEAYKRCVVKNDAANIQWLKSAFITFASDRLLFSRDYAKNVLGQDIKHILLLHMSEFVADVLDALLAEYKHQQVKFIRLTEALQDPIYLKYQAVILPNGDGLPLKVFKEKVMEAETQQREAAYLPPPPMPESIFPKEKLEHLCQ